MNEVKIYADDFKQEFAGESDFLGFLKNRKKETVWFNRESKRLKFEAIEKDTQKAENLAAQFRARGKEDVISDTLDGTCLILKMDGESIPVRDCAIKTILERARVSGNALNKVTRPIFARILNHCMNVADGQALLKISDDKVSAVHGGDKSDYSILEMYELFTKTSNYLYTNFDGVKYAGGFYDHSTATALWTLDGNTELVERYKDLLDLHKVSHINVAASVRLTTSDVGISGANLYPTLIVDGRNIPLGNPLKQEHKHGATMVDFENKLMMLYGQYSMAIGKLQELLSVTIRNPVNAMMGVMKKIGIPKKLSMEAIEKFKAFHGIGFATAHDIYYGISEVIFMLQCRGESGTKVTQMEETVARALNVKWSDYDIPGELKW